jgi:hypothetical protein
MGAWVLKNILSKAGKDIKRIKMTIKENKD